MASAMEVPALNDITIVTGGADGVDREAERQAVHFGTQLDVVIGPHHPRRHSITLLTKEDLEKTIHHFLSAQQRLGRKATSPMLVEYLQRNFYIAARAYAVYALGFFERNDTQMKGGTGWTVEFAKQLGRPIYAFHLIKQQWYRYNIHNKTFHRMGGGYFPLYKKSAIGISRMENGPGRIIRTDPGLPRTPNPHGGTLRGSEKQITLPQELLFFT